MLTQEEIDDFLGGFRCELLGNDITVTCKVEDKILYLSGMAPDRLNHDHWNTFFYISQNFSIPHSIAQLGVDIAHLLAEFAAHEVLEFATINGVLIHDSHKDGVLCVTTGPTDLGRSILSRALPWSQTEFPAVEPQSG